MGSKKKAVKKKVEVKKAKPKAKSQKKKSGTSSNSGSGRQLVLSFPGVITPTALILHPAVELEEWSPIGVKLGRVKDWVNFALGDWLNYGEAKYGEMYSQAASDTGMSEETLMILKYVASRVAPEIRIKDLTWSHHREVAKFPPEEQSRWLEKALKRSWSVRDLKDALKKAAGKDKGENEGEGREEGPPTGESCESCGSSPAGMRVCGKCMALAAKAVESIGIRGAIELLSRKPSKPQLEMLKWAYDYIAQPEKFDDDKAEADWLARLDALSKVVKEAV